ncbi:N,N-dimethylformamidase beta subunit family domain-containing protein [Microbacterium sp. K24]|uniref:N,N-dimethylformamidase beta subunit family domain-containing protein n=1 Tax=Microbacterium sp. K24 TaxID=2305446 RepID=UPI00109D3157|nr:N,N-dimethylformamidase beta subunit family domain-containing protein [Microbacterium sp. K24]
MTLTGYLNTLSAEPGEVVDLMVSASADTVEVSLVRLRHGDENPQGPGRRILPVPGFAPRTVPGGLRDVHLGSCIVVPSLGGTPLRGIEVSVLLKPTTPDAGREQGVISLLAADGTVALSAVIDAGGALSLRGADGEVSSLSVPWRRGSWYRLELRVSSDDLLVARCTELRARREMWSGATDEVPISAGSSAASAVIAAVSCPRVGTQWAPDRVFNGKIEHPQIHSRAADGSRTAVADWRLEREMGSARCVDVGGHEYHGVVINAPLRAATGALWRHEEVDFTKVPEQYGAIHFHDDDLDDAGWPVSLSFTVPDDLDSGVYAVELRAGAQVDHVPFAVRPSASGPRARIAVLLPTFTYIAYGNERMVTRLDFEGDQMSDHPIHPGHRDLELAEHPEWGLSMYDVHSDGSTCSYSTHLRPIPNLRPDYRAWLQDAPRHLSADLYLVDWLMEKGQPFDVLTDHDLHRDGAALLAAYDVVITGSHPEYVSGRMLDALEAHLDDGGSLMYLGGNGFYWVTSQDAERPHLLEIRRGPVGTRPSEGGPGQGFHSTTGEPGGMWRQRGRWPNGLTGIGMTAQGWDSKAPGYRRSAALPAELGFVFAGVDDEVIGDFGLIMNGSSGDEIDRFDPERGSPPETVVLATSTGHSDFYLLAGEDVMASRAGLGGTESPDVRSDMTWLEKPGGGAVFSVGSICFTGALSHNGYRNNVSTVMTNVIGEMLSRARRAS